MNWLKEKIHFWLVAKLIAQLGEGKVDVKARKVNMGIYSMGAMFFTPKDDLVCAILAKWFGYKFYEEHIQFTFTQHSIPLLKSPPSDDAPQYIRSRSWRQEAVAGMPDEKPQPNSSQ